MNNNNTNINISQQNVSGSCNAKCSYTFKYPESNSTATNNGSFITLTYDNGSTPPVLFNSQKYNVTNITIVSPSIHLFNNTQASGELYIEHAPVSGGQNLYVCIPLTSSTDTSSSSQLVTQIIQNIANTAPSENDTTNLNISDFSLDNIVPSKPYYNYTDPNNNNWIVFDIMNAIPISSSTLSSLNQIISAYSLPTPGTTLYYNSSGPNSTGAAVSEGIYISCQPTGSSDSDTSVSYNKNPTTFSMAAILNNPVLKGILEFLAVGSVCTIIYFLINFGYNKYINSGSKSSSLSSSNDATTNFISKVGNTITQLHNVITTPAKSAS